MATSAPLSVAMRLRGRGWVFVIGHFTRLEAQDLAGLEIPDTRGKDPSLWTITSLVQSQHKGQVRLSADQSLFAYFLVVRVEKPLT